MKTMAPIKEKTCFVFLLSLVLLMLLSDAQSYLMHSKKFLANPSPILKAEQCLESISWIPHCAQELFESVFTPPFKLGPKCCTTVKKINKDCLDDIINKFPLNNIILPIYETLCMDEKL